MADEALVAGPALQASAFRTGSPATPTTRVSSAFFFPPVLQLVRGRAGSPELIILSGSFANCQLWWWWRAGRYHLFACVISWQNSGRVSDPTLVPLGLAAHTLLLGSAPLRCLHEVGGGADFLSVASGERWSQLLRAQPTVKDRVSYVPARILVDSDMPFCSRPG